MKSISWLCVFQGAVITNYHKRSCLRQQTYSLTVQEARDLKSRCPCEALRKTPSLPPPVVSIPWRSWSLVVFRGVASRPVASHGIVWHAVAFRGVWWRFVEFRGVLWCAVACSYMTPISACDFTWSSSLCVSSPLLMRTSLLGFRPS